MHLGSSVIYWLINQRKHKGAYVFYHGMSLYYPLFLHCFLKWKRSNILWPGKRACLTLSFDCDYEEDVKALPQIVNILERYKIVVAFACVGKWVEKFPEIHRNLLAKGHEIINHSYSHPDNEQLDPERRFNELSTLQKNEQIAECHKVCKEILGYEPIGFRTPHFGRLFSQEDYYILKELGYIYSSSTVAIETPENGQPFLTKNGILEFPLSTCPRHPFSVFDSWHTTSKRAPASVHRSSGEFLKLFRQLIDLAIKTHSYINVYFDPQDIIKIEGFEHALEYLADKRDEIWITTYKEISKDLFNLC